MCKLIALKAFLTTIFFKKNQDGAVNLLLGLVIVLGLGVRLFYLCQISKYPNFQIPYAGGDADLYRSLATRIASGDILLGTEVYFFSPFYAYFLGFFYAIFGSSPWVAPSLNILLGLGTIYLVYWISYTFFNNKKAALLSALGASIYGPYLVFDTSGLKTSLQMFLTALALYLIARQQNSPRGKTCFALGVVLGLTVNVNGHVSFFIFIIVLLAAGYGTVANLRAEKENTRERFLQKTFAPLFGLVLGLLLTLMPFAMRNYLVAGDTVLTTCTGGIHFYIGNNDRAWGGYSRIKGIRANAAGHFYDAIRIASKNTNQQLSPSATSKYWKSEGYRFIRENPSRYADLLLQKALLLGNTYEIPDNDNYQYLQNRSPLLRYSLTYQPLIVLGLAGLFISFSGYRRLWPLYVFFFTFALSLIASFVTWRYRLPLTLILLPFASLTLLHIATWVRKKNFLSLGLLFAALALLWSFSNISIIDKIHSEADMKFARTQMNHSERESTILRRLASASKEDEQISYWLELVRIRQSQEDMETAAIYLRNAATRFPQAPQLQAMMRSLPW